MPWEQRGWGQPGGDTWAGRDAPALPGGPREPQTPGRSLQGPATPHGQGFLLPWLYQEQIEVFAQARNSPNEQTRVNCGVEQGLGLPAVPSGWQRALFIISHPFHQLPKVLHCPALLCAATFEILLSCAPNPLLFHPLQLCPCGSSSASLTGSTPQDLHPRKILYSPKAFSCTAGQHPEQTWSHQGLEQPGRVEGVNGRRCHGVSLELLPTPNQSGIL